MTSLASTPEKRDASDFSEDLISGNIRLLTHRTSIRLEPEMWEALKEISILEYCTIHDLCQAVQTQKTPKKSFTSALRVFMLQYYRKAFQTSQLNAING